MKRIYLPLLFVYLSLLLAGQTTFEKHPGNPLIIPDQKWETRYIAPNSIIYDNNQYQMWYTGGEFPALGGDLFIGYATSPDGYSWTKDTANPVFINDTVGAWDAKGVYKPSVLKVGSTYHMWYSGYSDTLNSMPRNIGHATSEDGISWIRDPTNPVLATGASGEWDYSSMANPTVVFDGTKYHMWYGGFSGNGSVIHIGHATSDDGFVWTKDPNNPVIASANVSWDYPHLDYPFALFDGTTFHIWYNAGSFLEWQLGYATSSDGSIWTKSPNPILSPGENGAWDSRYISMPVVLYDNATSKYKMWYRGESLENSNGGIGYAESAKKHKRKSAYTIEDWRMEIDEYWGEGDPTDKKLAIFDEIWGKIDEGFNTFQNLEIDWDALREKYRPEIEAGVSQGRFVGIINSMGRQLQETHLWLYNKPINLAPKIEPGTPVMSISSFANNRHFGATLTPMPDSSLLIYKAFPNHPLGLAPGDIVLGYEGVPWKRLYKSLLAAELPLKLNGITGSTKEACGHIYLSSAGLNWHLFDTIDIVKYDSGDTLHLPTANLAGQKGRIMGSDQVPIKGVDFWTHEGTEVISRDTTSGFYWLTPDINADYLTYGILENTEIGYIYLSTASNHNVSDLPSKVLNAFITLNKENIKGIIFDFRYNSGGSWSAMDNVFAYIYKNGFNVTNMFTRSSTQDHFLMKPYVMKYGPDVGKSVVTVRANPATNYHKPIALLTGPGCVSAGEYSVLKFKKYEKLRIFGKATGGTITIGDNVNRLSSSGNWLFGQPQGNTKLFEDSTRYMSHTGLEVDEEIWFDRDSVSMGVDNIVSRAVEWIQNETIKVNSPIIAKSDDEILLTFYPNPFKENAFLSVQLKNAGNLEIKIFNSTGKMIEHFNKYGEKGINEFKISGEKIGEGIYFYQVNTRQYSKSGKIIKLN